VGEALPHRDKNVPSGIFKTPLEGTLRIDEIELGGDARPTSPPTVTVLEPVSW